MRMIRPFVIGMLAALGLAMSRAVAEEDFYRLQPTNRSPDHLVPVPRDRNKSRLWLTRDPIARYEFGASMFYAATCMSLGQADGADGEYFISVTSTVKPGKRLTQAEALEAEAKALGARVLEERRIVSKPLAVAIQRVWARALLKTHYPNAENRGLDGVIYCFATPIGSYGLAEGQAWSPDPGSVPNKLVDLGNAICELATHPEQKEEPLIARLRAFDKELAEKK